MRIPAALTAPLALLACQPAPEAAVDGAWVRLAAVPGRPAAGYFTLTGSAADATLVRVGSPAAGRVELHATMRAGGGMAHMTMRPLATVAVPAGQRVAFAPGGRHLMLFDVAPAVRAGGTLRLDFAFADGRTLSGDARVIAAGDAPPSG